MLFRSDEYDDDYEEEGYLDDESDEYGFDDDFEVGYDDDYENEYDDEAFDEPEEKQAAGKSNRTSSKKDDFDIDFVDL